MPPVHESSLLLIFIAGKRYRTKKERMRIEKVGPPYQADGSLDYGESTYDPTCLASKS